MTKDVKIPRHGWVLVCDGAKALVFRNDGDAQLVSLQQVEAFDEPHPPTRDLGTDRPGRAHSSAGTGRSAMAETDIHDEEETAFLKKVAATMDELIRSREVKHLIVVAPPRALGVLRGAFTPAVGAVITAEISKDLAHRPTHEIEALLAA